MTKYGDFLRGNYSATRAIGDIPGCVPAVDVYIERDIEDVREHLGKQTDQYCNAIRAYIDGAYGGDNGEAEMWHDATKGNRVLPVFRNPSKASTFLGYKS